MMMRGEDDQHGTHTLRSGPANESTERWRRGAQEELQRAGVDVYGPAGEQKYQIEIAGTGTEAAVEAERAVAESEPYAADERELKENDIDTRAYMKVWSHYESAYNAIKHRQWSDSLYETLVELVGAIMGDSEPVAGLEFSKLIENAKAERARLLSRIVEQENLIKTLRKFIQSVEAERSARAEEAKPK